MLYQLEQYFCLPKKIPCQVELLLLKKEKIKKKKNNEGQNINIIHLFIFSWEIDVISLWVLWAFYLLVSYVFYEICGLMFVFVPGAECICDLIWEKSKRIIVGRSNWKHLNFLLSWKLSYMAECVYIYNICVYFISVGKECHPQQAENFEDFSN